MTPPAVTAVTAGDLVQEWAYRNGYLTEHIRRVDSASDASADITLIGRDEDGRITGLTRAGALTRYGYDEAGLLVAAATTPLGESGAAATLRSQVSDSPRFPVHRPVGPGARCRLGRQPVLLCGKQPVERQRSHGSASADR